MQKILTDHLCWVFRPRRFLYGKPARRALRIRGWESLYFVDNQADVEAVNSSTGTLFLGGAGNEFLAALLGSQSVFLLDHDQHRLARKIMAPYFSPKSMSLFQPFIDDIVEEYTIEARHRGYLMAGPWSRQLAMRAVCRIALGVKCPKKAHGLYKRFEATTGYLANIVSYARRFWQPRGVLSIGSATAALVRRIDRDIYPLIEETKTTSNGEVRSVLDLLVKGQEKHHYSDQFIRDNLVSLLAAGYDTTGSALSWMIYWYSLEAGTQKYLADARNNNNAEELQAFRDEVLRYCPPVEILPRRIDPDLRQQAESLLPGIRSLSETGSSGPMVCPLIHRIHHDQSVWTNPEKFDPKRFLDGHRYGKNQFLPFGAGPRLCVGMNLGRMLMDRTLVGLIDLDRPLHLKASRFNPIRRNVSIWPGYRLKVEIG